MCLPPTDCFGKSWKTPNLFSLQQLPLEKRTFGSGLLRLYYKTLSNLNCHRLSKEGSLIQSDVQSFSCPTACTENFARGHNNLDLVQRFLPELVLRGRQVLVGRICSVNLLRCYWRHCLMNWPLRFFWIRRRQEGDLCAPLLLKWRDQLDQIHRQN